MTENVPVKINEASLRRPDFLQGAPVLLADGQEYQLRLPLVRFIPDDSGETGYTICLSLEPHDDFQALHDQRRALFANGSPSVGDLARIELAMARRLLLANYDATPEQIKALLQFSYDDSDPEGVGIRLACMEVAMGNGPKPSGDGVELSHILSVE